MTHRKCKKLIGRGLVWGREYSSGLKRAKAGLTSICLVLTVYNPRRVLSLPSPLPAVTWVKFYNTQRHNASTLRASRLYIAPEFWDSSFITVLSFEGRADFPLEMQHFLALITPSFSIPTVPGIRISSSQSQVLHGGINWKNAFSMHGECFLSIYSSN